MTSKIKIGQTEKVVQTIAVISLELIEKLRENMVKYILNSLNRPI